MHSRTSTLGRSTVPEDWGVSLLGDLAESLVDGPFGSNLKTAHYVTEPGVRVVRLQNIQEGQYSDDDKAYISERYAMSLAGNEVRSGDILIAALGDDRHAVGRSCCYPPALPNAVNKADCFRLRVLSVHAENTYVMRYMNTQAARKQVRTYEQGVTRQRINLGNLRAIEVQLPPIPQQRAIIAVLDTLDTTIRQTEAIIEKLKQVKQGLLQDLLTRGINANGELRPPQRQAPHLYKESPLGRIPREWTCMSIRDAGAVQLGRQRSPQHERGRYLRPYLRVANVLDGLIDFSDVYAMNFNPSEQRTFSVAPGDIFLNEGQSLELVGRCAIYRGPPGIYCFQNSLVRFRCGDATMPEYARAVFKRWLDVGRFMQIAKQTTSMAHLGADRFAAMPIALPTRQEQGLIAQRAQSVEERLLEEQGLVSKLLTMKSGLMDDLLTGRVRVTPLLA